ncbi:MAG: hypothetical protein HKM92_02055 [Arenibacter sp.]|nr:hypothetical protein [Arenibacter sp.]
MRQLLVIFFLLGVSALDAQKKVIKDMEGQGVSLIQINSENCFKVELTTLADKRIIVESDMDGEYMQNLLLNVLREGNTVWIGAGFQPNFRNPNDKLSAHKVVSISLKISIPQYLDVSVRGSNSNISATGDYDNFNISLTDGVCTLEEVRGDISVSSQSGNIVLSTSEAEIQASSKYGKVDREFIPYGDNQFTLNSITGNIRIRKTE